MARKDEYNKETQHLQELADLNRQVQELKEEETNLRSSEERYRNFVENVEDLCFETDLAGNFTFINESACLKLGYSRREDLLGMNNRFYSTPEAAKKIAKVFKEVYRTGAATDFFEYEVIDAKKNVHLMQISVSLIRDREGKPAGFRGVARDVTERKKAEAQQVRSQNFIDNIEDACWELDLQGSIIFCNDKAFQRAGYDREEFMSLTLSQRHPPPVDQEVLEIYKEIYKKGTPRKIEALPLIKKDGSIMYADMTVSLIVDKTGWPAGFRGISRDVTERVKMAAEKTKIQERLNQAQKMEAIGTLAGGIAHDFNNLLMGIQGYTSLMLLDMETTEPNYEKLKMIESQVKSGADLTRQLLGYARGGRYEIKPTDLNELIEKTAVMFGRTKKEIHIHRRYADSLQSVDADQGQLEQVLLNLFLNAWQAMPGGGSLFLQTENVTLENDHTALQGMAPGRYVKVSVTDTGTGMDEKTRQRIFDPFFTTKGMGRGVGLGMASTYGIIRGHNGIITVYSEPGHGTTFNIYLPASGKKVVQKDEKPKRLDRGQEMILLVDDEAVVRDVTQAMLRGLGYQVIVAQNGAEAVELYQTNADLIAVVIMDMIMPGLSGGEVFDLIKAVAPGVKVILSSGYSLNGEAKEIMDRGCRAFLQKPFQLDDLSQKLRDVIEG